MTKKSLINIGLIIYISIILITELQYQTGTKNLYETNLSFHLNFTFPFVFAQDDNGGGDGDDNGGGNGYEVNPPNLASPGWDSNRRSNVPENFGQTIPPKNTPQPNFPD